MMERLGFHEVRPLLGGFNAWVEEGYPTEPKLREQ